MDCAIRITRHDQNVTSCIRFFEASHVDFYNSHLRKAEHKLYAAVSSPDVPEFQGKNI